MENGIKIDRLVGLLAVEEVGHHLLDLRDTPTSTISASYRTFLTGLRTSPGTALRNALALLMMPSNNKLIAIESTPKTRGYASHVCRPTFLFSSFSFQSLRRRCRAFVLAFELLNIAKVFIIQVCIAGSRLDFNIRDIVLDCEQRHIESTNHPRSKMSMPAAIGSLIICVP